MKLSPFWQGVASILDIFGTTPAQSLETVKRRFDLDAFENDWATITKDFEMARMEWHKRYLDEIKGNN